jgi:hypothetical protein
LKERFGKHRSTDLAILECLENPEDPDCASEIQSLAELTQEKSLAKEIRAALYRLNQKGIKLPQPEGRRFESPWGDTDVEAYIGPIDGSGHRIACLFKPIPGLGTLMIQALIDDEHGMQRMAGGVLPKKELRRVLAELKQRLKVIPADWKRVDALLFSAYRKAKDAGTPDLEEFPKLREAFSSSDPPPLWSPVAELFSEDELKTDIADDATIRLLEEPEMLDWTIPGGLLPEFSGELDRFQESPLILSRYQQQDRIQETVQRASSNLLCGSLREIYQHRLEEMAEYFYKTDRLPHSQRAFRAAVSLRDWTKGNRPPAFFVRLVGRSLAVTLQVEEKKKKEEVSLIIRP